MCACAPLLMLAGIGQAAVVDIGLNLSGSGSHTLGFQKQGNLGELQVVVKEKVECRPQLMFVLICLS